MQKLLCICNFILMIIISSQPGETEVEVVVVCL